MSVTETFVSETVEFAESVARPRQITRTVFTGALCVVAALMLQTARFGSHQDVASNRPILLRMINEPRDDKPSAYDVESEMTSSQLLNRWDATITEAAQRFKVPKAWIRAVMRQESGGRTMLGEDKPIVSKAGAVGLMQVMPATYEQIADRHKLGEDPLNARDNIMAGTAYLRWLHQRYGYPRMFAAYNAGPGRVERGGRLPAETRAYVSGIKRTLKSSNSLDVVKLTRPDGAPVKIDAGLVTAVRAPLPGEYKTSVKAVLTLNNKKRQAVRENVAMATNAIRATGGVI